MTRKGWHQLLAGYPWFRGAGNYPLPAYSEFMPPPRVGRKPCGDIDHTLFADGDDFGWHISEHEEMRELRPGLEHIGAHLLRTLLCLGRGDPAHGISRHKLHNNPCWPAELQESGAPPHERYVIISALALSRTQDDKGRVRWTLFGGSEHGPSNAFTRSEGDREEFLARLLSAAYHERDLDSAGFRVFENVARSSLAIGRSARSTSSVRGERRTANGQQKSPSRGPRTANHGPRTTNRKLRATNLRGIRYVLTFEPFANLPQQLKDAYRSGDVHLIPFPGSLVFWEVEGYADLKRELPLAMQIPLLNSMRRHEAPGGIRVPQSGWLHERTESFPDPHPHRGPFRETYQRTNRWAKVRRDEDELDLTAPREDKMAHVLFSTEPKDIDLYNKPMARNAQIWTAHHEVVLDGPSATPEQLRAAAERVRAGGTFGYRFFYPPMQVGLHQVFWHRPVVGFIADGDQPQVMFDAPSGYLAADGIELYPRVSQCGAGDLPCAQAGLPAPHRETSLTFDITTTADFKKAYWKTIETLAMGRFVNKDNADVVLDRATQKRLRHRERDLEPLAQTLIAHYRKLGASAEALRFHWRTDFPFEWSEGWRRNQGAAAIECDVVVKIPGRNRKRAVIMADHYDTAYMEDVYKSGARISAPGADDNCSATAALLLAAPIFLQLSRERRLESDIWLVHLTGEEFPSDCLGARALVQRIVEGVVDIDVAGAFVLDMIAHNNRKHPDIFQISPGEGRRSLELAEVASEVTRAWKQKRLRGEVRLHKDPRSTLYNTDAQIFSDAGLPVVLFMENYDIDRKGYHDSHDTMANIDLDYGAALAAIAIETVARVAAQR